MAPTILGGYPADDDKKAMQESTDMNHAMDRALGKISAALNQQPSCLALVAKPVSSWSVGQQIEHALHALRGCLLAALKLANTEGTSAPPETSAIAQAILSNRVIEKGTGDAPDRTLPQAVPTLDELEALLKAVESTWNKLRALNLNRSSASLPHHVLGPLTAAQWVDFGAVHTEHHLALVEDIIAANPRNS